MNDIVTLGSDDLKVEIWTLGARLNGVWFQGIGNLVDGAGTVDEARDTKKFNGAIAGPVANRIARGTAEIEGRVYTFDKNENDMTTLHSGATGMHAQNWTIEAQDDTFLSLGLDLTDGVGGFPGNRQFLANFEVIGGDLRVHFEAESDASTWVNMALHPYWTLGGQGRAGQKLRVGADRYTPVDGDKIPTGRLADVAGSDFDLRTLGLPSYEIDHNFCLNTGNGPEITLESDTGLRMDVSTNAPGVQIFTGKEIGIAIEPQHWPDAMHHADFPSIELEPGQLYQQTSTYQFSRR